MLDILDLKVYHSKMYYDRLISIFVAFFKKFAKKNICFLTVFS